MSRYVRTNLNQLYKNETTALSALNKNFKDIEDAINDSVSRSASAPTHMTGDLDMNGKRIINVPAPTTDNDLVRRVDVVGDIATVQSLVNTTTNAAAQTLQAAQEVQEIIQEKNVGLIADDLALGDDSKINQVAENKDNIDIVAGIDDDVTAVAALKDDIPVVVQAAEDIDKVEDIAEDITAVANNAVSVSTVAENISNINEVNANKTNINTVATNISDVNDVADIASSVSTVASMSSDIASVLNNETNINTVASNISDINDVAADLENIDAASSYAAEAKQWAIGDPTEPSGNSAKWWAEHSGLPDQSGQAGKVLMTDGSGTYWGQSAADGDGITINTNSLGKTQAIGVIDQRDTTIALKQWSGTKAQYDAIVSKDANTIYNVKDEPNTFQSLLETIYPVGSIYIGTMNVCPMSALFGTWTLVSQDRVLQGAGTRGAVGTTINESLPNITGEIVPWSGKNTYDLGAFFGASTGALRNVMGATTKILSEQNVSGNGTSYATFDASDSSSTYQDNAPVQQNAYLVNIWQRTA